MVTETMLEWRAEEKTSSSRTQAKVGAEAEVSVARNAEKYQGTPQLRSGLSMIGFIHSWYSLPPAMCIFCQIVAGEIPSFKLFEDELVLAFLDVSPLSHGHFLVIPKQHAEYITSVSDEALARIPVVIKRIALAMGLEDSAFNVLQNNGRAAGQVVPHVHFHCIPRTAEDGLTTRWEPMEGGLDFATAGEFAEQLRGKVEL
jgi:diadenosine tetraphosphate (Ap4A) HIT family hydrolase